MSSFLSKTMAAALILGAVNTSHAAYETSEISASPQVDACSTDGYQLAWSFNTRVRFTGKNNGMVGPALSRAMQGTRNEPLNEDFEKLVEGLSSEDFKNLKTDEKTKRFFLVHVPNAQYVFENKIKEIEELYIGTKIEVLENFEMADARVSEYEGCIPSR